MTGVLLSHLGTTMSIEQYVVMEKKVLSSSFCVQIQQRHELTSSISFIRESSFVNPRNPSTASIRRSYRNKTNLRVCR